MQVCKAGGVSLEELHAIHDIQTLISLQVLKCQILKAGKNKCGVFCECMDMIVFLPDLLRKTLNLMFRK